MKLSQNGVNFIKSHEALRLKAYQDSGYYLTIERKDGKIKIRRSAR